MTEKKLVPSMNFSDNFWETFDKDGFIVVLERMKGAKQTCERIRQAYESRANLEEDYGKSLIQIYNKQKIASTENGTSKFAMNSIQQEFISMAESRVQLAKLLRETIISPLSSLINRQKSMKKELQSSIHKLRSTRQLQAQLVRKIQKRHNLEIEKANLLLQQQTDEKVKMATYETAEATIGKLKKGYDEAIAGLDSMVEEWNTEWRNTCKSFEDLEKERLEFFKKNLSNFSHLMMGCLESEIKICENLNTNAENINVAQDLMDFVNENKTSQTPPNTVDYIKLSAYNEANQISNSENTDNVKNEEKNQEPIVVQTPTIVSKEVTIETPSLIEKDDNNDKQPVLFRGVMEVYPSDEEESDSEYITESESEEDQNEVENVSVEIKQESVNEVPKDVGEDVKDQVVNNEEKPKEETNMRKPERKPVQIRPSFSERMQSSIRSPQESRFSGDEKVNKLKAAYQEIQDVKKESDFYTRLAENRRRRSSYMDGSVSSRTSNFSNNNYTYRQENSNEPINAAAYTSKLMERYRHSMSFSEQHEVKSHEEAKEDEEVEEVEEVEEDEEVEEGENYQNAASMELDDMLRELDSKRINRDEEDNEYYHHQDVKPSSSISTPSQPSLQYRRGSHTSQYYQQQRPYVSNRRMSTTDSMRQRQDYRMSTRYSMGKYDSFDSVSSKDTLGKESTINTNSTSSRQSSIPSAQSIHDRFLSRNNSNNYPTIDSPISYVESSSSSIRSNNSSANENNQNFTQNYYNVSKSPSIFSSISTASTIAKDSQFIDFAIALYSYESSGEGEIDFEEGNLLGIISKDDDSSEGWWVASVLDRVNRRILRTGLVPSNYLGK